MKPDIAREKSEAVLKLMAASAAEELDDEYEHTGDGPFCVGMPDSSLCDTPMARYARRDGSDDAFRARAERLCGIGTAARLPGPGPAERDRSIRVPRESEVSIAE